MKQSCRVDPQTYLLIKITLCRSQCRIKSRFMLLLLLGVDVNHTQPAHHLNVSS